jgi:PAS domain-containing protein
MEHSENVRLVPLDTWERDWIRGALQHALGLIAMTRSDRDSEFRLRDLMNKIQPRYSRVDEDGKVVEVNPQDH